MTSALTEKEDLRARRDRKMPKYSGRHLDMAPLPSHDSNPVCKSKFFGTFISHGLD